MIDLESAPKMLFFFCLFDEKKNFFLWVDYQEINLSLRSVNGVGWWEWKDVALT